jgi:hypothetical protein
LVQDSPLHPAGNDNDLSRDVARELVRSEDDDLATSSVVATLRSAIVRVSRSMNVGSSSSCRVIGDDVQPGQTALTRAWGATRTTSFLRLSSRP